jgi:hypothetical protein
MIIYLNNEEVTDKYKKLNIPDILNKINDNLKDEVISKIFINNIEVNEEYVKEEIDNKKNIKEIKLITRSSKSLILETINESSNYLPRLKKGIKDTVSLFRNGEEKIAHNKYQLIIDGLKWYIEVITRITSLLDQKKFSDEINNLINDMNKPLNDLMVAYKKEDYVLVADILEYGIVEYVESMIEFNEKIKGFLIKHNRK